MRGGPFREDAPAREAWWAGWRGWSEEPDFRLFIPMLIVVLHLV